jgi:K+-sensing histidine kinase KdpD
MEHQAPGWKAGSRARLVADERRRRRLVLWSSVLAPFALGLALVPFRSSFAPSAAALLFIVVVAACAVLGNRLAGLVASVSAALSFDLLLTEPYGRLAISHRSDLETTVCLLVVGLAVTELAAQHRRHREAASEEASFVAMLHHLAELAAGPSDRRTLIEHADGLLVELLSLRSCRFDEQPAARPIARIEHDGRVVHAGIRWPAHDFGLPGPEVEIVVRSYGAERGRFVLTPSPGKEVDVERRIVAVALVDFVGAALSHDQRAA